jgi:hypothetical protein
MWGGVCAHTYYLRRLSLSLSPPPPSRDACIRIKSRGSGKMQQVTPSLPPPFHARPFHHEVSPRSLIRVVGGNPSHILLGSAPPRPSSYRPIHVGRCLLLVFPLPHTGLWTVARTDQKCGGAKCTFHLPISALLNFLNIFHPTSSLDPGTTCQMRWCPPCRSVAYPHSLNSNFAFFSAVFVDVWWEAQGVQHRVLPVYARVAPPACILVSAISCNRGVAVYHPRRCSHTAPPPLFALPQRSNPDHLALLQAVREQAGWQNRGGSCIMDGQSSNNRLNLAHPSPALLIHAPSFHPKQG